MQLHYNPVETHRNFRWSSFRGVLFDLDGLLIDSERISKTCWFGAAQEHGFDLEPIYHQLIGKGANESDQILSEFLGSSEIVATLRARKNELFSLHIKQDGVPLKPGASEILLQSKQQGLRVALATGSVAEAAIKKLSTHSIRHLFDAEVFGDDVLRGKPHPDIFLQAAQRLGVDPKSCLVIEDSLAGMTAAQSAEMHVVLVPDLVKIARTQSTESILVVDSLVEATQILSRER